MCNEATLTPAQIALIPILTTLLTLLVQFAINRARYALDKSLYVTKLRFDTEFNIYKELCLICSEIINLSAGMYDKANFDKYEVIKSKNEIFRKELFKNSPFISTKNLKYFKDFNNEIRQMLISYYNCVLEKDEECKREWRKDPKYKKYRDFCNEMETYYEDNMISNLRLYINILKIIKD